MGFHPEPIIGRSICGRNFHARIVLPGCGDNVSVHATSTCNNIDQDLLQTPVEG